MKKKLRKRKRQKKFSLKIFNRFLKGIIILKEKKNKRSQKQHRVRGARE